MNKENNSKVDIILSIVLGVLFILAMLFIFFGYMQGKNHDQYNQHTDCENINTGWTYTKEGENKSIDFPNKIDCKYGETVVLSNTIPADFEDGFYIYVNTDSCSVDAYIDGKEIQVVGIPYTKENKKYENPIVVLVVPDGSCGKKIDLNILNNGSKFRIEIYNVLYGPKDEIRFNLTSDAIPVICAAVVMVSLAIMFFVISFYMHSHYKGISEDYVCLALFILVSAIWIFTDLTTQGAYFVGSESLYLAHILSYMIFPIPFMMYINKQLDKRSKIIRCHTTVQMVFTVLVMLFFITNIFKYAYVLFVSHIVTCILLIEVAIIIILNILKHKKNNDILMLVGISILVVTGAMTVVNFYFNVSNDNTFAYKYGLIIFTCLVYPCLLQAHNLQYNILFY